MDYRAILFVPALAGAAVFGFVFLLFISGYYLTILESTGAGGKEVTWGGDQIFDNFWKVFYFLWLFGLWFGPAYLFGRAMTAGSDAAWLKVGVPIAFVWFLYPISQMSSLSASTIWLPLTPDVFARLAQKPMVTLGFYLLSIPVLALFGLAFKWTFLTKSEWELLFIGAPLLILATFLYARLIGRLAFVLRFTRSIFREKKKKEPRADVVLQPRTEHEPEPTFKQTRDLPPITTVEGDVTGYDLEFDHAPRPKKRLKAEIVEEEGKEQQEHSANREQRPSPRPTRRSSPVTDFEPNRKWADEEDEEATAYGVHEPEADVIKSTPKEIVKPREDEMRLISRHDAPKKPKRAWTTDLFAFLAQPGTVSALIVASGICILLGVMVRVAREFNPLD